PLWKRLVDEALDREELGLRQPWPRIIGYDADPHAVAAAGKNIAIAGLEDKIQVKQQPLAALKRPGESGMLLVNPPYGERLSDRNETKYLYRCLGRKIGRELYGWQIGFFAADPDLASMLRLPWEATFHLFNGPIKCRLHRAAAVKPAADVPSSRTLHDFTLEDEGEDFANRLRKNCISLFKWAAREDVSCFRIYDRDIPEYNLAVDLYEQWVHVQEYAPPPSVDPEKAAHRFNTALRIIRGLLAVPHSRVFVKTRQRQKGKKQYQKRPGQGKLYEVRERGCRFLVNFTDYLDTGLFLDHRKIRALLGGLAAGTRFLNLFGYTGTATVHALMNGAAATTLVDSSATYLQRARANMALNGFGGPQHITVQSDCLQWLQQTGEQYDLIFVDPPTFSNDRHKKTVFEVQRDHEKLLRLAMQHLAPAGLLIFSTNFRKFQLAGSLDNEFAVREITGRTIPEDFKQKSHIHRCWEFRQPATNR
ncbi:MAG TPA: bifunctional 23S rRNA (guanine(2069)-N(7))-methyltransferase RlmK/23S rRNA (guanine(2445)-N(2))-methyltransferase RlmL, partial [Desulfobacteraceae bacterium]|nr:bifunctional 23S rRNA (guanine(2069)-N(7))-methyltransferase RlmK/23S rRNA (guanine(2445)-N(2))-methyltransferase RlmL [Desulfobacteraceae bacterium]